jgi:hypothetical protein
MIIHRNKKILLYFLKLYQNYSLSLKCEKEETEQKEKMRKKRKESMENNF